MASKSVIWITVLVCLLILGCNGSQESESNAAGKDPFAATTGAPVYKGEPSASGNGSSATPTPTSSLQGASEYDGASPIVVRSPNGKSFVIFEPNPAMKTPFQVKKVSWVNNCKLKEKNFVWSDMSEGNIFWVKYASKFDVKLKLDREVQSWTDLLEAQIVKGPSTKKGSRESILEDDYGKHNNINMNHDWYFAVANPFDSMNSPCPKP